MTYFDIAWCLLIIKDYLRIADYINIPDRVDDIFAICIFGIFCISIISKKYNKKELFIYIFLGLCALYTGLVTGYMLITTTVLSVIAVKDEDLQKIAKNTFRLQIFLLLFNTAFSCVVSLLGYGTLWGYTEDGTRFRIHLGYGMAGHLADCILNLICIWIYTQKRTITRRQCAILISIATATFLITDSRTVFLLMIFVIMGTRFVGRGNGDEIIRSVTKIIVPGCTMIMLVSIYLYSIGNKIGYLFDRFMNSRVRLCGYNLDRYGITMFGKYRTNEPGVGMLNLKWHSDGMTYDNTYMWMIINMGIIWILVLCARIIKISKIRTLIECILLISFALGAMLDTSFSNSACCFSLLLLGQVMKNSVAEINEQMITDKMQKEITN